MNLDLEVTKLETETHIVLLEKRLTVSIAHDFETLVLNLIDNGCKVIVLDLSNVIFLDSSGLGALVAIRKAVKTKENLRLCSLNVQLSDLLQLTALLSYFEIYDPIHNIKKQA